jgi:hypothetical protein
LRRMAISPDAPRNTASRMIKVMRLLLSRSHPHVVRVCSYQSKSVHTGSIYRADGFRPCGESSGSVWDRLGRRRIASQQIDDRVRWERPLRGSPDDVVGR